MPVLTLPVEIELPIDGNTVVPFRAAAAGELLTVKDGALEFALPEDTHVYLGSKENTKFAVPPKKSALRLEPDTTYTLRGKIDLTAGQVALWLIEYDECQQLCHQKRALRDGAFQLTWKTHARHQSCCLALRISGAGRLRLGPISITTHAADALTLGVIEPAAERLKVGPGGRFAAYSLFFDPSGYREYTDEHHHFYDGRDPIWYGQIVEKFQGCRRVLDVGCGPGLLLQALSSGGVENAVGLERDPHYLASCRTRQVHAVEHDLNLPFPFLASASFDGVVAHQSLDYLAPIAIRTVLRECRRVLQPGGRLYVACRSDGQESGDVTRTVPLKPDLLRRLLEEAGFGDIHVSSAPNGVRVAARRPDEGRLWPVRRVLLQDGNPLTPWQPATAFLPPTAEAWDNLSNRDFTLLTSSRKDELQDGENHVAYYTGYRREGDQIARAICRAISRDGMQWRREPEDPVLEAGAAGSWDDGGVAAGSVIRIEQDGRPAYLMYYTGRRTDGQWGGIGLARSRDGINWEKRPDLLLSINHYANVEHLALADVIQTAAGRWLMHCEGWVENAGWAVFQAESDDGLNWRPTQTAPVLDPGAIPWGGAHAANPKCVEASDGRLVLGFNASDSSLRFQLGLAESENGRDWRLIDVNPVICTTGGDYRVESFFMTRDSWRNHRQRVYFFGAASRSTERSSRVLVAETDPDSAWVAEPWQTQRPGLYRIQSDRLVAEPGATTRAQALTREIKIERELQCSLRFSASASSRSGVLLTIAGDEQQCEIGLEAGGRCTVNGESWFEPASTVQSVSLCLRIVCPRGEQPEFSLQVWHGEKRVLERQEVLPISPRALRIAVQAPPGEPSLVVDHVDVRQPLLMQVESFGDAHMYMGVCGTGDPLLPDVDAGSFAASLKRHDIGRALVMPYGSNRALDSFDQIAPLARERLGVVYPLLRCRPVHTQRAADIRFRLDQLELLWQTGRMYGLKIHMRQDEIPGAEVLDWVERRQVLTLWHVGNRDDLDWLIKNVLERYTFPVLLSHFGGYPLDRKRYKLAIDLLDRFRQLYLVSSVVTFAAYLRAAIKRWPERILLGSDFPAIDPTTARAAIQQLAVPDESKVLVTSENLRFLTERVQWFRWQALQNQSELRFRPLPGTPEEVKEQGFVVVPPGEFEDTEFDQAKEFWSGYEVKSWYRAEKPWARLLADLVADLKPRSVLEFGCNVGRNLVAIAQANPDVRLAGIDVNPEAIRIGRERTGLDLRLGDENTLRDFDAGEFDLVFTVSVLDHISDIRDVCRALIHCAGRNLFLLEVTLPVEGKVLRHYDHAEARVRESTGASYSWHVAKYLEPDPRVWRLDCRPCYLHDGSLGPYYWQYLAFLEEPASTK